jgi:uncharacterized membrane protein
MTTLQAVFAGVAQRTAKARDRDRIRAFARTALGIGLVVALLVAGIALRALVYVRLS